MSLKENIEDLGPPAVPLDLSFFIGASLVKGMNRGKVSNYEGGYLLSSSFGGEKHSMTSNPNNLILILLLKRK